MSLWIFLKYAGILTVALIVLFISFLYLSYLNETIIEGEGYGFTIGMTKEEAFKAAKFTYQEKKMFVIYSNDEDRSISSIEKISFSDENFVKLQNYNVWSFFYGRNSIDLTFGDGALIEVHRHRQYFELP